MDVFDHRSTVCQGRCHRSFVVTRFTEELLAKLPGECQTTPPEAEWFENLVPLFGCTATSGRAAQILNRSSSMSRKGKGFRVCSSRMRSPLGAILLDQTPRLSSQMVSWWMSVPCRGRARGSRDGRNQVGSEPGAACPRSPSSLSMLRSRCANAEQADRPSRQSH